MLTEKDASTSSISDALDTYLTPNKDILERADIPTMFALLSRTCLRWLGHVYHMEDGRIPKDVHYGELASGASCVGRLALQSRDVCERDIKYPQSSIKSWESAAADYNNWQQAAQNSEETNCGRRRESTGEKDHRLPRLYIKLSTPVPSVAETATKNRTVYSHNRCCAKH